MWHNKKAVGARKWLTVELVLMVRFLNHNPKRKRGISKGKLNFGPYRGSASLTLRVAIVVELFANETAQHLDLRFGLEKPRQNRDRVNSKLQPCDCTVSVPSLPC